MVEKERRGRERYSKRERARGREGECREVGNHYSSGGANNLDCAISDKGGGGMNPLPFHTKTDRPAGRERERAGRKTAFAVGWMVGWLAEAAEGRKGGGRSNHYANPLFPGRFASDNISSSLCCSALPPSNCLH